MTKHYIKKCLEDKMNFKKLDEQTEYNMKDGLSVQLHGFALKKLGLDWNTMDTDDSNDIFEICHDVLEQMHDELETRLIEWREKK